MTSDKAVGGSVCNLCLSINYKTPLHTGQLSCVKEMNFPTLMNIIMQCYLKQKQVQIVGQKRVRDFIS